MHPLDPEGSTLCLWPVLVQKEERGLLTVSELRGNFLAPSVLHEDSGDVLSSLKFIHTRRKGTSSLCFLSVLVRGEKGDPRTYRSRMGTSSLAQFRMRIQRALLLALQNSSACFKEEPPCVSFLPVLV